MQNFGALQFGSIPAPLRHVRPFSQTQLSNGIKVCTEAQKGQTAHIGVYVNSGSRDETLANTGSSYLTQLMALRGTSGRSKTQLAEEIETMGARYSAKSDREWTKFGLSCFSGDTNKAVALLGDMISNIAFNSAEFELLKEEVTQEHEDNHTRFHETTLENVHFNSYREHMLGQPIKGDRDMTQSISLDTVRDYHAANYYGDNITVVATGEVSHEQVCEAVEQYFGSLPQKSSISPINTEKPIHIPGLLMIRDDEMYNSNVGVFFDAPSAKDEDYYAFRLLQAIIGTFRFDKNVEHLNDMHKQYNSMHAMLGNLVDVTRADCHYFAYSDCGIFGNYFFGNEVFTRQMNFCGVHMPTVYAHYLNDVEVIRGRASLFNDLLVNETPEDLNNEIGHQMMHVGRRVPRTEFAKRIAHLDNHILKGIAN